MSDSEGNAKITLLRKKKENKKNHASLTPEELFKSNKNKSMKIKMKTQTAHEIIESKVVTVKNLPLDRIQFLIF